MTSDEAEAGSRPRWSELPREEAIPLLLEVEGGRLHALARRFCGDPDDAEDVVQDTFLAAWRAWDTFEGRAEPATWLYRIAARACGRRHARRAGEPERVASLEELLPFGASQVAVPPDEAAGPLDEGLRREALARLGAGIAGLAVEFRMPLVLKEVLGLPVAAVAEVLGLPAGTVKSRLHRARLELRRTLEDVLPRRELPPPAFERQVCLDLLEAKQEALDRGVPFTGGDGCERCRALFRTLDLETELCQALGAAAATPDRASTRARLARLQAALERG